MAEEIPGGGASLNAKKGDTTRGNDRTCMDKARQLVRTKKDKVEMTTSKSDEVPN